MAKLKQELLRENEEWSRSIEGLQEKIEKEIVKFLENYPEWVFSRKEIEQGIKEKELKPNGVSEFDYKLKFEQSLNSLIERSTVCEIRDKIKRGFYYGLDFISD